MPETPCMLCLLRHVCMRCVDTSHFSKDEKSLLRGGGLMSQQSGPPRTNTRMADNAKVMPLYFWYCSPVLF